MFVESHTANDWAAALPPILNVRATALRSRHRCRHYEVESFPVVEMTKAAYARFHCEERGRRLSLCGGFRFRVCRDPKHRGPRYLARWVAAFFIDSTAHTLPDNIAGVENW
ncbi:MAG: hypothetical protein EOQ46_12855 [Mesorhizobium sp.]|uniref:hypothetical protein n=1 Tax=Mesorhizobium sp. TaxID=1871066 RepID=UPI000FE52E82|nr:hypothetical protein [Mesorhizobium sp.]RWB44799.1 MAG: hypothetical protein EOQ46_12855 [Mesorhizobium sp.]